MNITSILAPEKTFCGLSASSKKKAIELAAEAISERDPGLDVGEVYRGLIEREKVGTTAIGHGVAIPHCRLKNCSDITGALFVFSEPVDFAAYDEKPVNIMFVLLVPEAETDRHLKTLAMLAEKFEDSHYRTSLLAAGSDAELFQHATTASPPHSTSVQG